ncbi:hypothetical protein FRC11_008360 [Ceratobasidium sp. 423]|nr:hypothetical protein FRC11_008360 [Ceratobasidium sp. 423]
MTFNIHQNCGGTDKSQIDETLLVRLCSPCQEQCLALLVNTAQVPVGIREFVPKSNVFGKARRGEELPDARVLKSDVDRVIRALGEAERSGDENILAEWMKDMEEAALERKKRSKYITRALAFYQNELDWEKKEIQTKRRREIERRCIVILEFEREDLQFTLDSPKRKEYYKLLEKPELLSDREWEEIRSTLVRLLRANRNRKARLAKKADNQRQLGCSGQFSILETDLVLDGLYQGEGVGLLGWSWE